MKTAIILALALCISSTVVLSQSKTSGVATDNFEAERTLAKLAVEAHGGDKFRRMRTLSLIGTVDVTASSMPQPIPATFVMIFAGDRYRVELNNPFQPIKQVFDGARTTTSVANGFTLPPFNRVGFPVLQRVGDPGFAISSLPENKKKKRGFRITSPEGYATDFYLDDKTNQIKGYDSNYDVNGRSVSTVAEIDKIRIVDGVSVPEKYVQRFSIGEIVLFANFNARQITVNQEVANDVFVNVN
jgi:hypothetical protein